MPNQLFEETAISKYWKRGKCANTVFADGGHRVGMVPVYSVMDGAIAGDSCREICLECECVFDGRAFVVRPQPNKINAVAVGANDA